MTNEGFDHIIQSKLKNFTAEVPDELWDRINIPTIGITANAFDIHFAEKLGNYSAEVSPDLWDRIVPEEKKRRFFFILPKQYMAAASLAFIVMVSAVSAFMYYTHLRFPTHQPTVFKSISTSNNNKNNTFYLKDAADAKRSANLKTNNNSTNNELSIYKSTAPTNQNSPELSKLLTSKFQHKSSQTITLNNASSIDSDEANDYINTNKLTAESLTNETVSIRSQTIDKEINYLLNHARNIRNVIICPSDKKMHNTDWDIELFSSPFYAFKTVTNNTASTDFLSRKDSSEKMNIGYSAGFSVIKPLNSNFSLKAGIQFTQANEKLTYRTENELKTTTVITVRNITLANGTTITVSDTSILQQIGYKTNTVNNRYKTIDVPVLLAYQLGNEDFRIGVNAGILFNVTSWYNGVTLDTSFMPQPITKESNVTYKNNIGLGLYAGLSFTKRINYNTLIFAEPYLRYNLSNMTTPQSTFNQRFTIGGLALGVRFNLNNR